MASKKFSLESILSLTDGITAPMNKMQTKMMGFSKTMKKNFGGVGKDITALSKGIDRLAGGLVVAGGVMVTAMGAVGLKALELASDLTEVQNVVDTTFGPDGAKRVNEWSRSAITAFGLSELQAKKFNGTMGAMLKSSGLSGDSIVEMSTALSGLAGDFASFYNLDAQEAFDKIRSGISGETEPLKQLGINMSVANLEAFALTQGISKQWLKMSQAEQVQLRYLYLLKSTADAQGDFAKTLATSWANQKRVLQTKFWDIVANAVSKVLPMLVEYGKLANEVLDKVGAWVEANKELIATKVQDFIKGAIEFLKQLVGFIKLITPLAPMLLTLVVAIKAIAAAMAIYNAVAMLNPTMLIVAGVIALIAIIVLVVQYWDEIVAAMQPFIEVGKEIWAVIQQIGQAFMSFLLAPINMVIDAISGLLNLLSKIPGMGDKLAPTLSALQGFQGGMNEFLTGNAEPVYASPSTYGAESRSYSESRSVSEVFVRPERGAAVSSTPGGPAQPSLSYGRSQ